MNVKDCLTNYVGLRGVAMPIPESDIYLNELPGMSTELVHEIATDEELNYVGVWADVQNRAFRRFKNDLINSLFDFKYADFKSITYQTKRLLKSQRNPINIPADGEWRGVYFTLPESRYTDFRVNEVYLFSQTAGPITTTMKVWDMNDGTELLSKTITIIQGLNVIPISQVFDLKYRVFELFVGIDCTNIITIETLNDYYYWYNSQDQACGSVCRAGFGGYAYGFLQVIPSSLDITLPVSYDNLNKTGLGKGVVVSAEILCSIDQFICENKHHFQQSLVYLLGAEMLMQKMATYRLNYFASTNLELTNNLRLDFEGKYASNLKRESRSVPLQGQSICFSCEETMQISTRGILP
jgi:hypothetical protein